MKNILIYTNFILYSLLATAHISAASHHIFSENYSNIYSTTSNNNDYDLMLTGVVLCQTNGLGLGGVVVELIDLLAKDGARSQTYVTGSEGAYYFILERDKRYFLSCKPTSTDEKGGKYISTIDEYDKILNSILQVSTCGNDNFEIDVSPLMGNEGNKGMNDMPKLSYRIQIGMFKQQKSDNSSYLREVGYKIVEEQSPSGFYRYLTEDFYNLESTEEKLNIVKSKGYDKAYIVAYHNNERLKMSPQQAKEKYGK